MPLNPMGVLDISIVTDLLKNTISDYWPAADLWTTMFSDAYFMPNITGLTPEAARKISGPQLTISLLHIEPNRSQRNYVFPLTPQGANTPSARAQMIPALPLGLDLYYFISAYSENNYQEEQQAISIVLNCFHQTPILRTNVVFPGSPAPKTQEEFSLTMEIESVDTMSRLWQAVTAPFRLSVMYKVAVVFMTPPAPPVSAKPVVQYGLAVEPTSFPFATSGQVFGTSSTTTFTVSNASASPPESATVNYSPATVTPGERFSLNGAGLNLGVDYIGAGPNPGTSYRVFVSQLPDYSDEQDVTATWKVADANPANPIQTRSRMVLQLPGTVGALPGNTPAPGVYTLRVGSQTNMANPAAGDVVTNRTNATPFNVAARVDTVLPAAPAADDVCTISGLGFVAGKTEVLLDTLALSATNAAPAAGEFNVASDTSATFKVPANLRAGTFTVRVRVNGVESPPGAWIKVS